MNLCNGRSYSSVEEMIKQDGYDSVEAWVPYILNSDTVSDWWTENIQFYTYDGTLNNSQVAALTSDIFSKLFGNSNVNWDATVSFRLLELYNAENTPSFMEFGSTKPDKVILLQFGEPIIWINPLCRPPLTAPLRRRTAPTTPSATASMAPNI